MLTLCLAGPQAGPVGGAKMARAAGAAFLTGVAIFATPEEFTAATFAGSANAAGARTPRADARFPGLPTRDAGSGPICIARQPLIDATLKAKWADLGACGALGSTTDFPGVKAVAAAALVIAQALAAAANEPSEIADTTRAAVSPATLGFIATAGIASKRNLLAGLADLVAAAATGTCATSWATGW